MVKGEQPFAKMFKFDYDIFERTLELISPVGAFVSDWDPRTKKLTRSQDGSGGDGLVPCVMRVGDTAHGQRFAGSDAGDARMSRQHLLKRVSDCVFDHISNLESLLCVKNPTIFCS